MESNNRSSIPITVRQLEAIVRITESLAKLSLSPIATEAHVDEAIRLFLASTMDAVTQGEGQGSKDLMEASSKIEDELKRRLPSAGAQAWQPCDASLSKAKTTQSRPLTGHWWFSSDENTVQIRSGGSQIYRNGV